MKNIFGYAKAKVNQLISTIPQKLRPYLFAVSFGIVGVTVALAAHATTPTTSVEPENGTLSGGASLSTDSTASGGQATKFGAAAGACTNATVSVSALLVPSCGAWLGGYASDHGITAVQAKIEEHETRIGRQLSFVHTYHTPSDTGLSTADKYFINRPNTYLLTNWKPATNWSTAGGSNSTVNANIDSWADSIKSVAPKKVMLIIAHEPQNDVSGGGTGCGSLTYVGSSGTPADYRAMWANVRARFDAKGVTNVVWAINYMSDAKWDCLNDDLWPGNNLVDWVLYNTYPGNSDTWATGFGDFYSWLTTNSDATHDYLSKPWGIGEWGSWATTQSKAYQLYDDGATAIANGDFPKLKLYTAFDAIGVNDSRVDYTNASAADATEMQHYKAFANSSGFVQP